MKKKKKSKKEAKEELPAAAAITVEEVPGPVSPEITIYEYQERDNALFKLYMEYVEEWEAKHGVK